MNRLDAVRSFVYNVMPYVGWYGIQKTLCAELHWLINLLFQCAPGPAPMSLALAMF